MDMEFERKLPIPMEVKEMYPLDSNTADTVKEKILEIEKVLAGEDARKILIVGPCSADNEESVLDYVSRLSKVAEKVSEKLLIVPRVYTNKPRTTGEGYKGMVHSPTPGEKPDPFNGIIATRKLHMRVVQETGLASADEMLYPENFKYIDDLLAYTTVGARSVENQQHRLTASGVGIPVGMKNPTRGDNSVMLNAILTAQHGHTFIYRGWAVHSKGNPFAHAILRGRTDMQGVMHPNYKFEDLVRVAGEYKEKQLLNPSLIIDSNHANSGKDPFKQENIITDVIESIERDSSVASLVKGFMVESYIEDGAQKIGEGKYGCSITDACLGWDKTEKLIYKLADMI